MEIKACPHCGSRKIFQGTLKDGVLTGYTSRSVCKDCGYQGSPIIFDSEKEYKKFVDEIAVDKKVVGEKTFEEDKILIKEEKNKQGQRPMGVTILTAIMILNAVFSIYIYYEIIGFETIIWLWIYYIIIFALSAIILPYGLLKGKSWAWSIASFLYAISIPIGLIFLYYLTRPHVRKFFGKE
jgi:transcription elongation factor Elf1